MKHDGLKRTKKKRRGGDEYVYLETNQVNINPLDSHDYRLFNTMNRLNHEYQQAAQDFNDYAIQLGLKNFKGLRLTMLKKIISGNYSNQLSIARSINKSESLVNHYVSGTNKQESLKSKLVKLILEDHHALDLLMKVYLTKRNLQNRLLNVDAFDLIKRYGDK